MARTRILPGDPLAAKVWGARKAALEGQQGMFLRLPEQAQADASAHAIRVQAGLYLERRGGNVATHTRRLNCVNCGAPHEPVCSYCGTVP